MREGGVSRGSGLPGGPLGGAALDPSPPPTHHPATPISPPPAPAPQPPSRRPQPPRSPLLAVRKIGGESPSIRPHPRPPITNLPIHPTLTTRPTLLPTQMPGQDIEAKNEGGDVTGDAPPTEATMGMGSSWKPQVDWVGLGREGRRGRRAAQAHRLQVLGGYSSCVLVFGTAHVRVCAAEHNSGSGVLHSAGMSAARKHS